VRRRLASVRTRLRDEEGVTLFEALLTISIGLVLLGVVFLLMEVAFSQTAKVNDRVEAVQRGRTTMEQVTRQLRSQVCPATTNAALIQGDGNSVTFYLDLSGGAANPERHTIAYDPNTRVLTEYDYTGSGTWPALTYGSTPTRTRQLLKEAVPVSGTPVFTYYAFTPAGLPTQQLATPLADADLPRVVRIALSFVAQPTRTRQAPQSTTFQSEVDVRTADPNNPTESTRCL
jgi:hypothetical protein